MKTKLFGILAGIVWAGAAMSSATPASALVWTHGLGANYATCGASNYPHVTTICDGSVQIYYDQNIKLISTACGSGGGCNITGVTYTDIVYSPGRKPASLSQTCYQLSGAEWNAYGLGACAC